MTQVVIPSALRSALQGLTSEAELIDEAGRVIGRYLPSIGTGKHYEPPSLSEEEMLRIEAEDVPDYSFDEVMEYLRKL